MENTSPRNPDLPPRPSSAPTAHMAVNSDAVSEGWRPEYESDPAYQRILARMEVPWWRRPVAVVGGVVAVAVASFLLGLSFGGSGGSDNLTPAEQGKSDAQAMVRSHTEGQDVSITDTSPEFSCNLAEQGVGYIHFYDDEQIQEYMTACEQEYAALTHQ